MSTSNFGFASFARTTSRRFHPLQDVLAGKRREKQIEKPEVSVSIQGVKIGIPWLFPQQQLDRTTAQKKHYRSNDSSNNNSHIRHGNREITSLTIYVPGKDVASTVSPSVEIAMTASVDAAASRFRGAFVRDCITTRY